MATKRRALYRRLSQAQNDDEFIFIPVKKNSSTRQAHSNRDSKFRGVSKNGKKWQVMFMGNL
jgi:hypothetical protein